MMLEERGAMSTHDCQHILSQCMYYLPDLLKYWKDIDCTKCCSNHRQIPICIGLNFQEHLVPGLVVLAAVEEQNGVPGLPADSFSHARNARLYAASLQMLLM